MEMTLDSGARLCVPGFGLPVYHYGKWNRQHGGDRLPHAISDWFTSRGITLRERRMLEFISQITDKPNWARKVFDEKIVAKWKEEAVRWDESIPDSGDWWLSEKMFEVCMHELQEKAGMEAETGMIFVLDAESTIVKSDCAVSAELCGQLKEAIRPLEDVPEKSKDWHPGSSGKVLDLVHPSLFPVVYGTTRVLPTGSVPLEDCTSYCGKGETTLEYVSSGARCADRDWANGWGRFQWLPSRIQFTADGIPKIISYINNLHPSKHAALYPVLERFVDAAIPLWNECISWYQERIRIPISSTSDDDYTFPEGVVFPRDRYRKQKSRDGPYKPPGSDEEDENELDDEEWAEEYDCWDEYQEWKVENRVLMHSEPGNTWQKGIRDRPSVPGINLKQDFKEKGLQVIFKLANIHLTPEQEKYEGGTWHVEGALNEHICATALYYYDSENVTDSRLAFRQSYDTDAVSWKAAQNEFASTLAYYGIEEGGDSILELGSVLTRQGRLLAFPNILQHQVQPFELADKTRPGHRKILAMFLVDPHIQVLSTANVPPQSKAWWSEEVRKVEPFDALPEEIYEMIIDAVEGFPISWDEAAQIRKDLMEDRSQVNYELEYNLKEATFSFCEH
ncbi:hypothetical protein K458DRAFT_331850 [Lentithecium fluviatile CBS 122367]|uniref:Duf1665 domain containing protein n=1 Tax=Lentithecium fluviatile CBS 122367 TaxID=1168545 RepID=A0A6G1JAQ9_9PLEO|nr:hypothetical protein K458DRAFT_331850 [Lentithecium fluviatile CBS 122367]